MNVISLFSGCGGLDSGFDKAGFELSFHNDSNRHCCRTLRLNGRQNVDDRPIEELSGSDVRRAVGGRNMQADVLIGGPPCQPFSKSGYWSTGDTLRLRDPRADTLRHYLRLVDEMLPQVFLLENVHGLSYDGKEEGFRYILDRIWEVNRRRRTNYAPVWAVLNVADYGVPQLRVRFFLVAERSGQTFVFPPATHAQAEAKSQALFPEQFKQPYVTAWEAIGHIPEDTSQDLTVGGSWGHLLPSIPEGENYLWHTDRKGGLPLFGWRTRYWSFLLKLAKSLPSWTIQAQPGPAIGPFHWKNRRLSWQELAAIQTFPREFRVDVPRVEIQRQIGNAVPSLMGEIIARAIAEQFFGRKYVGPPCLQVPRKRTIPPPEPVELVPEKYHRLIGRHQAHPGTGKGPSHQGERGRERRPSAQKEFDLVSEREQSVR